MSELNIEHKPLAFIWHAKFSDGTCLEQFDFETGKEHRFQEVLDRMNELEYFILFNTEKVFTVDLINGLIYFNTQIQEKQELIETKENIRLVYFRRNRVEIGEKDLKEQKHEIIYFLGLQYLKDDKNMKIIFQIDGNGSWVIGE